MAAANPGDGEDFKKNQKGAERSKEVNFTDEQIAQLENFFETNPNATASEMRSLATIIGLPYNQVNEYINRRRSFGSSGRSDLTSEGFREPWVPRQLLSPRRRSNSSSTSQAPDSPSDDAPRVSSLESSPILVKMLNSPPLGPPSERENEIVLSYRILPNAPELSAEGHRDPLPLRRFSDQDNSSEAIALQEDAPGLSAAMDAAFISDQGGAFGGVQGGGEQGGASGGASDNATAQDSSDCTSTSNSPIDYTGSLTVCSFVPQNSCPRPSESYAPTNEADNMTPHSSTHPQDNEGASMRHSPTSHTETSPSKRARVCASDDGTRSYSLPSYSGESSGQFREPSPETDDDDQVTSTEDDLSLVTTTEKALDLAADKGDQDDDEEAL